MSRWEATPWSVCLRQERIARNWRQRDLAEQVGTSVLTIQRWERGNQQPSAYFRVKLCTLFGKSAEELGWVNGNPSPPSITEGDVSETEPVPPTSGALDGAVSAQSAFYWARRPAGAADPATGREAPGDDDGDASSGSQSTTGDQGAWWDWQDA